MTGVLPSPLMIWSLALAALALGLRSRRRQRPVRAVELPAAIRASRVLPVPQGLVMRAASRRIVEAAAAAGLDPRSGVATIARSRIALAESGGACGLIFVIVNPLGIVIGGLLAVAGYFGPLRWVQVRARQRRRQVVRELPDLIDLVVICTESGMALEPSLRLASERLPGVLAIEVGQTLRELDLGTHRRDAYVSLAQRLGVPQLTGLVGSLLQADELGAPIASVLTRQGELLRSARTQDIREHAARAAPKVQLVVAMVMVPAALLVVLGVLIIQLIGQIGGVVGGVA